MHSAGGDPIPDQAKEAVLRQHPSHLTRLLPVYRSMARSWSSAM
jgi:hypothetical protein